MNEQKIALVTGASRGIGAEIALELSKNGMFANIKNNWMLKTKKYYTLFLIPVLMLFFVMPFSSCNPHRRGAVIKGKSSGGGRHVKTATAKKRIR